MSGTTSGKLRIRAVAQRMARGESGVTLVEMMVSLFIFAIVSTMFTTAIVQYLHSTSADAIRSRSSTEIATSVQSLDRYVRYAEGVEYDATNHTITMVTPGVFWCEAVRGDHVPGRHVEERYGKRLRQCEGKNEAV